MEQEKKKCRCWSWIWRDPCQHQKSVAATSW